MYFEGLNLSHIVVQIGNNHICLIIATVVYNKMQSLRKQYIQARILTKCFKIGFLKRKTRICNLSLCCRFKGYKTYFSSWNAEHRMQHSHETKMDAVCADIVVISTRVSAIVFRPLNQKVLSQTTTCGIIITKGLTCNLHVFSSPSSYNHVIPTLSLSLSFSLTPKKHPSTIENVAA